MTLKRKIIDKNGVQVFPITHTKAVLDDNGNSVEQRLQEQMDVINQKQLEVGAVPSDVMPTENSTNWVTSGGVFDATNLVFDFNFDKYFSSYVRSNDNTLVNNNNFKSIYVENDGYNNVYLFGSKFSNTVAYAIAFFSGYPSDTTFISGVQSIGNVVADYDAEVPAWCKYIVLSSNNAVTATAQCCKKLSAIDSQLKNISVKKQMTDFDSLELLNYNANSTSQKINGNTISISSIVTKGRTGIRFGDILVTGKQYVMEFDFESTSTNNNIQIRFGNGTEAMMFVMNIINNAHAKFVFTAQDKLNTVWMLTDDIGTDKTVAISNFELYEVLSLTEASEYIKNIENKADNLLSAFVDETTYDGAITKGYIKSDTKEVVSMAAFDTHVIPNEEYVKIHASCGNKDSRAYAVAFYSSKEIGASSFISGALFTIGQFDYDLDVPASAQIIVVSSRINDSYGYELKYKLYKHYDSAKVDIDRIAKSVESLINNATSESEVTQYEYSGTRIELNKMCVQMKKLTSREELSGSQGFALYGGYFFIGHYRGVLQIMKYSDFSPNLIQVAYFNLASYGSDNHCNCLCFGNKFADDDMFPALYVSECTGNNKRCFVERVTLEGSSLLQTISFPTFSNYMQTYINWVVDLRRGRILAVGVALDTPGYKVLEFPLPSLEQQTVTLTDNDILDEYTIYNNYVFQGALVYGNMLILPSENSRAYSRIIFFDLTTKTVINTINMEIEGELEDCDVLDDDLILNYTTKMYRMKFF